MFAPQSSSRIIEPPLPLPPAPPNAHSTEIMSTSSAHPAAPARRNTTTLESAHPNLTSEPGQEHINDNIARGGGGVDAQPAAHIQQGARRRGTAGSSLSPGQQGGIKRKLTELFVPEKSESGGMLRSREEPTGAKGGMGGRERLGSLGPSDPAC